MFKANDSIYEIPEFSHSVNGVVWESYPFDKVIWYLKKVIRYSNNLSINDTACLDIKAHHVMYGGKMWPYTWLCLPFICYTAFSLVYRIFFVFLMKKKFTHTLSIVKLFKVVIYFMYVEIHGSVFVIFAHTPMHCSVIRSKM